MTVKDHGNEIRFIFKGAGLPSAMLLLFQIGSMSFVFLFCLYAAVSAYNREKYWLAVLGAVFATGVFYICWRMLARITKREQLLVSANALVLTTFVNGKKTTHEYPINEVQNLCYLGSGNPATHSLASDNLDALGFGARQELVNFVAADGNIAFYHGNRMIRIGIGVSSWDAEIIDRHIREKTVGSLVMAGLPDDIPNELWNRQGL